MNFPAAGGSKKEFDFTEPKVLETVLRAKQSGTEFMGSATSDFQSHPYLGHDRPRSDWDMQVHRLVKNKRSKILGEQNVSEFPQFFKKKELYIKRCAELGENMFRLSFDFGRLCPKPGEFDAELMKEYIGILASIRDKGLEPMLTVYHWPSPTHLLSVDKDDKIIAGAWEHSDVLHHFRFYIQNVLRFLADKDFVREVLRRNGFAKSKQDELLENGLVRYFVSINEPINLLLPTYILGIFPPFKKLRFDIVRNVITKVVEAHDIAINEIRNSDLSTRRGPLKIGAAHNWTFFDGWLGGLAHHLINARLARKFEREKKETDFVGLHYYFRMKLSPFGRGRRIYGDNPYFGDIHPPGILKVLKEMHGEYPNKDIFITEFGFSDNHGLRRPYWILETVRHVIEAMEHRIPVKGMLLWTLVNNFEWNLGLHQKFGLFDENELDKPLVASAKGHIKSWEAWGAAVRALTQPNTQNLRRLQNCYLTAKEQFHGHYAALKKRPFWSRWR